MTGLDHAAEAMLCAVVDESGDLLAAFARLCAGASMGDVQGETYRDALERMIRGHFGQARGVRPAMPRPARDRGEGG